jgi:rhodanese-related sulfurtransferase
MIRNIRVILCEAAILAVAGIGLALLANQLSPRGLSLKRDYFARAPAPSAKSSPETMAPPPSDSHKLSHGGDAGLEERLRSKGLNPTTTKEAEQLFRDPQYEQELIVFVDARDDRHYQEGHIPGAYQFDRYYPEKYLPAVLPACLAAARVVVYCTGGKCEDSEFAATTLVEAGVPAGQISVYLDGITDWLAQKLPVETGARKSGTLREQTP